MDVQPQPGSLMIPLKPNFPSNMNDSSQISFSSFLGEGIKRKVEFSSLYYFTKDKNYSFMVALPRVEKCKGICFKISAWEEHPRCMVTYHCLCIWPPVYDTKRYFWVTQKPQIDSYFLKGKQFSRRRFSSLAYMSEESLYKLSKC